MKSWILGLIACFCFVSMLTTYVESGTTAAHGMIPQDPEVAAVIKKEMDQISTRYFGIQAMLGKAAGINYDQILRDLSVMESSIRRIRKFRKNGEFEEELKRMSSEINGLHKYAYKNNPIKLQKGMDTLFKDCFSCHAKNRPASMWESGPAAK